MYSKKGRPPVFRVMEIEKPVPKDDEVLVNVHAASVNSWDWELLKHGPRLVVLGERSDRRYKILGADVAGRVEAVGSRVSRFQPGDEVFGDLSGSGWGGFAEYTAAREDAMAMKPVSMTFEQAAAIPQAGQMAIQGIRDKRRLQPGEEVLINGAGGGVGTFALQIAKTYGAEVTGVDRVDKLEMLRSIGADHVIDYEIEDYTRTGKQYDLILDMKAYRSVYAYRRALHPGGAFAMVGGSYRRIFQVMLLGQLITQKENQKMELVMLKQNKDLDALIELFEAKKVVPIIDRCYPLDEIGKAIQYCTEGHVQGKVIIDVVDECGS